MPAEDSPSLADVEGRPQRRASLLSERFAVWAGFGANPRQQQDQRQRQRQQTEQQRDSAQAPAARSPATKRSLRRQPTPQLPPPPPPPPLSPPALQPSSPRSRPRDLELARRVAPATAPTAADDKGQRERATESLSAISLSPCSSSLDSFESTDGLLAFPTASPPPSRPGRGEDGLDPG
ncbi:unnamed protein product, partial [Scytosiphon promiscuus]